MQADALRTLHSVSIGSDEDDDDEGPLRMGTGADSDQKDPSETFAVWPEETLLQVGNYLRLSVSCFLCFPLSVSRVYTFQHHTFVWVIIGSMPIMLIAL